MSTWLAIALLCGVVALTVILVSLNGRRVAHKVSVFEGLRDQRVRIGIERLFGRVGIELFDASGVVSEIEGRGAGRRVRLDDLNLRPDDPSLAGTLTRRGVPLQDVRWVRGGGRTVSWEHTVLGGNRARTGRSADPA